MSYAQSSPGQQISSEPVLAQELDAVPPAPAFIALARFSYAAGAFFPTAQGAGPVTIRVLAGSLSFHTEGVVVLTRGGPGNPATKIPAGSDFTVTPGDQLLVPGDTPHSAKSDGPDTAVTEGLAIFREAPVLQFPEGIEFHPLALGPAATLPTAPAFVRATRFTYPPGADDAARQQKGPGMRYVESGTVSLSVDSGAVFVNRAPTGSGGPPPAPEPVQPPAEVTLNAGDGAVVEAGASVGIRNTGAGPAVVVDAAVEPDQAAGLRDVANAYYYDAWNAGNLDVVGQVFAPDFVNHRPLPGQQPGPAGVAQWIRRFKTAFPDGSVEVDLQFGEGDRVVNRYTFRGTHRDSFLGIPATGRRVELSGIDILRVEGGKIREGWGFWDTASLIFQLGQAQLPGGPPPGGPPGQPW